MKGFLASLSKNQIFLITLLTWLIAQSVKVTIGVITEKRFNFRWFTGSGGMPSSHAAGVAALATSVGLAYGFNSGLFAVTAIFALIIMFDAQGVRRHTGQQAEILNKIIEDIYFKRIFKEERLKELLGHTPVEVFAGALLGIVLSLLLYH